MYQAKINRPFSTRRSLALLIALLLLLTPLAGSASPAYGATFGDLLYGRSIIIGNTAALANETYWSTAISDKITENYITYQPDSAVRPIIGYGNDIYGAAGFSSAATVAETESGGRILAGMNGDFFTMANGVPQGMTVKAHALYTSGSTPALGFFDDGRAIMGNPQFNIKLSSPKLTTPIGSLGLNKEMTAQCGLIVYTDEYSSDDTNRATIPTYNVSVRFDTADIRINGSLTGTVQSAAAATGASAVPAGTVLLSMAAGTPYTTTLGQLKSLAAGDTVTIDFSADPAWDSVAYGIGTGDRLVSSGQNVAPMNNDLQKSRHPRTAVGIKPDGSLIFYTVDGRLPGYSGGVTMSELADRMIELGAADAVNLDGGGSTATHGIYPGDGFMSVINKPSQGSLRSCANYIMLLNPMSATGSPARLHLYPYNVRLLAGASQAYQIKATDQNYYPATAPTDVTFETTGGIGTVDGSGRLTAGSAAATGQITAHSGNLLGAADVEVVAQPDSIKVVRQADSGAVTQLALKPGESVDLTVLATYRKMPLTTSDTCFTWSIDGGVGTVDAQGVLTAADASSGVGTLTVGVGSLTAQIGVTISAAGNTSGWLIDDFEKATTVFSNQSGSVGVQPSVSGDLSRVRYGMKCASLKYSGSGTQSNLFAAAAIPFTQTTSHIHFWLYGDGSGNTLGLVPTGVEKTGAEPSVRLDFTGWKLISWVVPTGATGMSGFSLKIAGAKAQGTLYLDQLIGSVGAYSDTTPPSVTASLSGGALTGNVSDAIDTNLSQSQIEVSYDGKPVSVTYNPTQFTATLAAADGKPHLAAVTAVDLSGNRTRVGVKIPASASMVQPFTDMKGHWAGESAAYLFYQKIASGTTGAGGLRYLPEKPLTRAEFAVLMTKFSGLDPAKYSGVKLPYADAGKIPSWALNSVKAMYQTGMIQGVSAAGKVYYQPAASITREQVMTIIGRTLPRGFAENNLSAFTDRADVSAWAAPFVRPLVQMKAVSGYGGKLWPKNPVTRGQVAAILHQMR